MLNFIVQRRGLFDLLFDGLYGKHNRCVIFAAEETTNLFQAVAGKTTREKHADLSCQSHRALAQPAVKLSAADTVVGDYHVLDIRQVNHPAATAQEILQGLPL